MKRIVLSLSILLLYFSGSAQRSLDLEVAFTSPATGSTFESMETFNLSVMVKNADASTTLEASDSVYYYMLIFGDTVAFMNGNYLDYTGNSAAPNQSFNIGRLMAFTEDYENVD